MRKSLFSNKYSRSFFIYIPIKIVNDQSSFSEVGLGELFFVIVTGKARISTSCRQVLPDIVK